MNSTFPFFKKWLFLILLSLVVLQACGFHLRGMGDGEANQIKSFSLSAVDQYGDLAQLLINRLETSGIELVTNGQGEQIADVHLFMSGERFSRRAASTTGDISVAEYEIRLEADVLFSSGPEAEESLPQITIFEERTYSFDGSSLVGSGEEEGVLKAEMRRNLVEEIIRRANRALTLIREQREKEPRPVK